MSHFSVIVIGQDPEKQLAPYHEFESTGQDDQYVKDIEVTEEVKEKGLDWYDLPIVQAGDEGTLNFEDKHKYGYVIVNEEKKIVRAIKRTNPNKKWDWYQLGGRWTGFFKVLEPTPAPAEDYSDIQIGNPGLMTERARPGHADSALKKHIDFVGMMHEAGIQAAQEYDKMVEATEGIDPPTETWKQCRERVGDIDKARELFNVHPWVKAASKLVFMDDPVEAFCVLNGGHDAYINKQQNRAFVPYAVVKDGQWYAKGEMGWWGCSNDHMEQETWNEKVSEMLMALDDNERISLYDCHI